MKLTLLEKLTPFLGVLLKKFPLPELCIYCLAVRFKTIEQEFFPCTRENQNTAIGKHSFLLF
jgi:hypothetical protein